jgi:hypothetical protein
MRLTEYALALCALEGRVLVGELKSPLLIVFIKGMAFINRRVHIAKPRQFSPAMSAFEFPAK